MMPSLVFRPKGTVLTSIGLLLCCIGLNDAFRKSGVVHLPHRMMTTVPVEFKRLHGAAPFSRPVAPHQQSYDVRCNSVVVSLGRHKSLEYSSEYANYANPSKLSSSNLKSFLLKKGRLLAATILSTAAVAMLNPTFAGAAVSPETAASTLVEAFSTSNAILNALTKTGFYQAFSLVFLSEIGDKTFFIAGLLAMKTSKVVSYVGSMGALVAMTAISVIIGQAFHAVPSGIGGAVALDDLAAVAAFTFFGVKTIKEALDINDAEGGGMDDELAEAEEAVEGSSAVKQDTAWAQIISTFGLVFAAEFGDRSFLSTIALSAAQNPLSVAGGAIAAHGLATGLAVYGGSYIAKYISEKVIGLVSGTLFLVFAVTTALGIF